MDKSELRKIFYENVEYMQKTVPPDDIYIFSEQTFMAAMFFMLELGNVIDLVDKCNRCPVTKKWVSNILSFENAKRNKIEILLDLKMDEFDEDNN